MNIVARVANKSGILNQTMSKMFTRATLRDKRSAKPIETPSGRLYQTKNETTKELASVAVEPTDKSNPLTVKETVKPIAIIVTIEMLRKILIKFVPCRNVGAVVAKNRTRARIARTIPQSFKNPRTGRKPFPRFVCFDTTSFVVALLLSHTTTRFLLMCPPSSFHGRSVHRT